MDFFKEARHKRIMALGVQQPVYEVIKREDIMAAMRDAITAAFAPIMAQLQQLIDAYAATAPASLWTWGYTSRWGYDMWY